MSTILADHLVALLQKSERRSSDTLCEVVAGLFDALEEGHICLDANIEPALPAYLKSLRAIPSVVGKAGEFTPLILDHDRLYFARYWKYENDVAIRLKQLAKPRTETPAPEKIRDVIQKLYQGKELDRDQATAIVGACLRQLTIVSGGPGTGKTTTVARIIAARQMLQGTARPLRIKLAAYTGKAADRLRQAISQAKVNLNLPEIAALIPEDASTLHRLLGMSGHTSAARKNRENPLALDLLVLDEVSMIDLSMMAKILDALPEGAGLILLGDKDQLDAVQPGSVFGELCTAKGHSNGLHAILDTVLGKSIEKIPGKGALQDCLFTLRKSYRFHSDAGIGSLAAAVNAGNAETTVTILQSDTSGELRWNGECIDSKNERLKRSVIDWLVPFFGLVRKKKSEKEIFDAFNSVRLLTPLRHGPLGTESLNEEIRAWLRDGNMVGDDTEWYAGRPIMITANNYALGLYNGDIGIALDDEQGRLSVVFPSEGGTWRRISTGRLSSYEPAFACTVHKSQGSEFDNVLLVIPDGDFPVITRNLLYTGITRAKRTCELWCSESSLRGAVERVPLKASGLGDRM